MDDNPKLEMPLEDFAVAVTKENQRLRDILYYSGIVEIAAHNNRVTEYMFHWEGRALDAEAKIERLNVENIQMRFALGYPMPADLEQHILPRNPFRCGVCDARAKLKRTSDD